MASLARKLLSLFAGSVSPSGNIVQIGSTITGVPVYTADPDTIQALPAYGQGLGAQVVNGTESPVLEEDNAFKFLITYMQAYMFQAGIPEYLNTQEYPLNGFCRVGKKVYVSKQNANTGKAVTNTTWWDPYDPTITGTIVLKGNSTTPAGYLPCDGTAVSRVTYADLYAAIGTAWGAGNGTTTFNVPDFRGRAPVGLGTGDASGATAWTLGRKAGQETVTLVSAQMPSHSHTTPSQIISTSVAPNHVHSVNPPTTTTTEAGAITPTISGPQGSNRDFGDAGNLVITSNLEPNGSYPPIACSAIPNHHHSVNIATFDSGSAGSHLHTATVASGTTYETGGGGSHTNLTPSIGCPYFIKT